MKVFQTLHFQVKTGYTVFRELRKRIAKLLIRGAAPEGFLHPDRPEKKGINFHSSHLLHRPLHLERCAWLSPALSPGQVSAASLVPVPLIITKVARTARARSLPSLAPWGPHPSYSLFPVWRTGGTRPHFSFSLDEPQGLQGRDPQTLACLCLFV